MIAARPRRTTALSSIRTVRDLCTYVTEAAGTAERPLDEYLRALWRLGAERHRAGRAYLTAAELAELLTAAFDAPAPPFDPGWRLMRDQTIDTVPDGYTTWEATVREQILDLDELVRSGLADTSGSFFAVDADEVAALGGSRWGNLAPRDFLSAACTATFGEGSCDGSPTDAGPLGLVDWDRFATFLAQGQRRT
jgi:hypothetical protein